MAKKYLSDDEVFGTTTSYLSDEEVFGAPARSAGGGRGFVNPPLIGQPQPTYPAAARAPALAPEPIDYGDAATDMMGTPIADSAPPPRPGRSVLDQPGPGADRTQEIGFMLRPEFVEEVRNNFAKVPPEKRREALIAAASGENGINPQVALAAQRILAEVKAEDAMLQRESLLRQGRINLVANAPRMPAPPEKGTRPAAPPPVTFPDMTPSFFDTMDMVPEAERIQKRLRQDEATRAVVGADISLEGIANRASAEEVAKSQSRQRFAEENPILGSLASGSAGLISGTMNIPSVAADAFNKIAVNPMLRALGMPELPRVSTVFGTEYLTKAASDFMPKVGKQEWEEAVDRKEFAPWLISKLAANSPQIAQSLAAAYIPPLRAAMLPSMAGTAAGQSFVEGDDSRVALAKGTVEYFSEKLPLGVFDKVNDALKGMSPVKANTVLAVAGQRLLQAGGAITANTITNAVEEIAAQFGSNVLDKYFQGKEIELSKGLAEAGIVGGATGKLMSLPQAGGALTGAYDPNRQIAREIDAVGGAFDRLGPADTQAIAIDMLRTERGTSDLITPAATVANFTPPNSPTKQAGMVDIVVPMPGAPGEEVPTVPGTINPTTEQQFGLDKLRMGGANVGTSGVLGGLAGEGSGAGGGLIGGSMGLAGPGNAGAAGPGGGLAGVPGADDRQAVPAGGAAGQQAADLTGAAQPLTWTGRAKTGYANEQDAEQAMATASAVIDTKETHDWRVEPMGNGRFQIVGYQKGTNLEATTAAAPAAQAGQAGQAAAAALASGQAAAAPAAAELPGLESAGLRVAPTAPVGEIKKLNTALSSEIGVTISPVKASDMNDQQKLASAVARLLGKTLTVVHQETGTKLVPNGMINRLGGKHIYVADNTDDAPLFVAVHEAYHGLPEDKRQVLNKALLETFRGENKQAFLDEFGYDASRFDEEAPAMIAQAVSKREDFWQDLRTKMGNKEFGEVAKVILTKLTDIVTGAKKQYGDDFVSKYITDIAKARDLLSTAYAEAMQAQGLKPDVELTAAQPMASGRSNAGGESFLRATGFNEFGPAEGEWVKPVSKLGDVIAKVVSAPGEPVRMEISADYMGRRFGTKVAEGEPAIKAAIEWASSGIQQGREKLAARFMAEERGLPGGPQTPMLMASNRADQKNPAASRIGDVSAERFKRTPALQVALQDLQEGRITRDEYNKVVDETRPVYPYKELPEITTEERARFALANGRAQSPEKAAKYGLPSKELKAGELVQGRLDIPSYQNHDAWVVTIHRPKTDNRSVQAAYDAGPTVGYESVAAFKNATFGMRQSSALKIAQGASKGTIATILGEWVPITPAEAKLKAQAAMKSKQWIQVGMDPFRHSHFYDRNTMRPVVAAEDVIQIGPLVLAKNAKFDDNFDVTGAPLMFSERAASAEEDDVSARGLKIAQRLAREWKQKLGSDVEVVMGGSLISGTFVQTNNEPIDMDVRFLSDDPKSIVSRVEDVTGLKLRKEIQVNDFPVGTSTAYMVEGVINVDGVEMEVEGAVRSPAYVGWASFYRDVFTKEELEEFKNKKAELKGGDKKVYKALKNEMLLQAQERAIVRGLVPVREYEIPPGWTKAEKTYVDENGFERGLGLNSNERFVEQRFYDAIKANQKGVLDAYFNLFPHTVDADLAKELSGFYAQDPGFANAVHEPSSYLSKAAWTEALNRDQRPTVIFTGGGSGSGKSYSGPVAREQLNLPVDTLTFDSALSNVSGSVKRIEEALAKGRTVQIVYTNTPAKLAFTWSLGRKRLMKSEVVANAHAKAAEAVKKIADKYSGNPRVNVSVVNITGRNNVALGSLADVPVYDYNQLVRGLDEIAKIERNAGKLSEERYRFVVRRAVGEEERGASQGSEGRPEGDGRRPGETADRVLQQAGGAEQSAQADERGEPRRGLNPEGPAFSERANETPASGTVGAYSYTTDEKGRIVVSGDTQRIRFLTRKVANATVVEDGVRFKGEDRDKVLAALREAPSINQAIAREVAEKLGLTPQELASTSLEYQTGLQKDKAFVAPLKGGLPEVVKFLEERRLAAGLPPLDITKPADQEIAARLIAAETLAAIRSSGNALQWYDETIARTLAMIAVKYPELQNNRNSQMLFRLAMAITSQGLDVESNLNFAMAQYDAFRKQGQFPVVGQGEDAKAMANNFALVNELLNEMGPDMLRRFLVTPFTVKELRSAGFDPEGELGDEVVLGSSVLGPKIGFGFYSNLNGNFEPVTMDMWFMRLVGRIIGALRTFDADKFGKQIGRFRAAFDERGTDGIYADQFDPELVELARTDNDAALRLARLVNSQHQRDFLNNRKAFDSGARKKSELVYASATMLNSADKSKDVPANGSERRQLRAIVKKAVEMVEKAHGQRIPPAAMQALVWYPEQELYKAMGVKLRVTSQDYAGAALKILKDQGYGEQQLVAAAESGSKRIQQKARRNVAAGNQAAGAAARQAGPLEGTERDRFIRERYERTQLAKERAEPKRRGVVFEVAPDPNNGALTAAWRSLGQAQRLAISERVAREIVPRVLAELDTDGIIVPQVGSYLDDTNPSFTLLLNKGDPVAVAKALGFALAQDSMMVVSPKPFAGGEKNSALVVEVGDKTPKQVEAIYKKLRQIKVNGEQVIGGQSYANGGMTILNYSNVPTSELAILVDQKLNKAYSILTREVFAAFPEKKEYDYASAANDGRGSRAVLRQRTRDLRAEATAALERELRDAGVQFSQRARPDATGGERDRGLAGEQIQGQVAPSYGTPREGATSAVGYHYSQQPRDSLASQARGTGLRGAEMERLRDADPRLQERIYFYIDRGTGIQPEAGVGGYAHRVNLQNLYDADEDPLRLVRDNRSSNDFELAVLDAGFDGYMVRDAGPSGNAVLLGRHDVPVEQLGPAGRMETGDVVPAARERVLSDSEAIAANKMLPAGQVSGKRWAELISRGMPEIYARLADSPVWQSDKPMYRSELAKELRDEATAPMFSARDNYQEFRESGVRLTGYTPKVRELPAVSSASVLKREIDRGLSNLSAVIEAVKSKKDAPSKTLIGRLPHVFGMLKVRAQDFDIATSIVYKVFDGRHRDEFPDVTPREFVEAMYRPAMIFKDKGGKPREFEMVLPITNENGAVLMPIKVSVENTLDPIGAVLSLYNKRVSNDPDKPKEMTLMRRIQEGNLLYVDPALAKKAMTGRPRGGPKDGVRLNDKFLSWAGVWPTIEELIKQRRVKTDVDLMGWIGSNYNPEGEPKRDWADAPSFSNRAATPKADPELASIFKDLDGARGLSLIRAQERVDAHPMAETIRQIDKDFLDILERLDDAGLVKINCK